MKGVTEMRMTQKQICHAIRQWLADELRYGYSKTPNNTVPFVVSVNQSKRNGTFLIKLSDDEKS